ncbi:MAG: S41 family peptidase, partial [Prochlorothrix sp.]|nr:S41 family peptidase [Prochlorothrix sp.]
MTERIGQTVIRWCSVGLLVWVLGWPMAPARAMGAEEQLLSEVWRIVNRAYVDPSFNHQNWWLARQRWLEEPLENREQTYRAIEGMLATLGDPYTRFLPPEEYRSLQTNTSGELTGVGLQIAQEGEQGLVVIAPVAGSPAAAAGLQPRDRIMAIDGTETEALSLDEAAQRMRGPRGTTVTLTVARRGWAEPHQISLRRDLITLNPVVARLDPLEGERAIGYIHLTQFNGNAVAAVGEAIRELGQQGAMAYVLDLRNNPGGLLTAGIEIARQWLDR